MDLEEQLRNALKREWPSAGFATRVTNAAIRGPRPGARGLRHWRAVAAGLTLTALLAGWAAHQVALRREGERARDEVMVALHIAGAKVRYAQTQVHEIGSKR